MTADKQPNRPGDAQNRPPDLEKACNGPAGRRVGQTAPTAMNSNDHTPTPPSSDHDPALRAIEADLAELARRDGVPVGFERRIFEASAAHLPAPKLQPVLTGEPRRFLTWSRLAMAACVGLIVVMAGTLSGRGDVNTSADFDMLLATDLVDDHVSAYDLELGYLLDTSDLTSGDIAGELGAIFPELEM